MTPETLTLKLKGPLFSEGDVHVFEIPTLTDGTKNGPDILL